MLNHNGKVYTDKNRLLFSAQNRAFSYADALFETIRIVKNNNSNYFIPLWNYHFKRLSEGMQAFGYDRLESNFLKNEILKTVEFANSIQKKKDKSEIEITDFKARLTVFRSEGGLYTPTTSQSEFVIVLQEIPKLTNPLDNFDLEKSQKNYIFFDKLPLFPSAFSAFKKVDALPYILAGKYRKQEQADEVFLLNNQGRIAEAGAANVFILDKNLSDQNKNKLHFITPPASEGGVMGTLQNYLLDKIKEINENSNFEITFEEKSILKKELNQSEIIFTTNAVQSIQIVKITTQKQVEIMKRLIEKVNRIFL